MILIVDDDAWFVRPLRLAFEMEGFTTAIAADPQRCMEMISGADPVDAVVLDVMLPPGGLDMEQTDHGISTGLFLLARIREKRPDVPIIIWSVRRDFSVEETDSPPTAVLSKGEITPEEMVDTVRRLIGYQTKRKG